MCVCVSVDKCAPRRCVFTTQHASLPTQTGASVPLVLIPSFILETVRRHLRQTQPFFLSNCVLVVGVRAPGRMYPPLAPERHQALPGLRCSKQSCMGRGSGTCVECTVTHACWCLGRQEPQRQDCTGDPPSRSHPGWSAQRPAATPRSWPRARGPSGVPTGLTHQRAKAFNRLDFQMT